MKSTLYYGDNLEILRERIASDFIDLIYLDPPFNSNRSYNVLFGAKREVEARAQIQAFDDTWTWTQETERLYFDLITGGAPPKVADAIQAMHGLLGENDVLAYLVMMAARLVELHRVLKPTGSIYLHCDPTTSHYLKMLMDAIFGPKNFLNEIIWKRSSAHSDIKQGMARYGRIHDVLFFYRKGKPHIWNPSYTPYTVEYLESEYRHKTADGRYYKETDLTAAKPGGDTSFEWRVKRKTGTGQRWEADLDDEFESPQEDTEYRGVIPYGGRYWGYSKANLIQFAQGGQLIHRSTGMPRQMQFADEMPGVPLQDLWTDIPPASGDEDQGFATQKPLALLRRIIESSSDPGDVVLDPFCGCGTTVIAAQELGRTWIGIDVTYIAVDLMRRRLEDVFAVAEFDIDGIPRDMGSAEALFLRSPFDFERWAVSSVYGQPNEKQVGDRGSDGVIRFPMPEKNRVGRVVVSVKGGSHLGPNMVRDLAGTVDAEKADMGVLITMGPPTAKMVEAAHHTGSYVWPVDGRTYPKVQIVSVEQLLGGHRLEMPPPLSPYSQARRHVPRPDQLSLDQESGTAS